jgi:lipopolysaccharide transport system ATP-binding protein
MSDVVIRAEGLSKMYRIGENQGYWTLREAIVNVFKGKPAPRDPFWALKDVSFEIKAGEVIGVIGRNGAGKSTLLKILSRITRPTRGRAEILGRVGALLEVGTGFHHELTGRENIFLNGAILGVRKEEIKRQFDAIVAFAEVEKFVDTPVKHYSSGMYLRLAFAVAAHLEPEVLIVDEVLAVGDASFQKRCLAKMGEVSRQGRTVLFVSHNIAAITALTQRCLLLKAGELVLEGPSEEIASRYLSEGAAEDNSGVVDLQERLRKTANADVRLMELIFSDQNERPTAQFYEGEPINLAVAFDVRKPIHEFEMNITISAKNLRLFSVLSGKRTWDHGQGCYVIKTQFSPTPLRPGLYTVSIAVSSSVWQDGGYDVATFEVLENPKQKVKNYPSTGDFGVMHFPYSWREPEPALREKSRNPQHA